LVQLFQTCVFKDIKEFKKELFDDLKMLAVNIIISQRPVPDLKAVGVLQQSPSDGWAGRMIEMLLEKIQKVPTKTVDDKEVYQFTPDTNYIPWFIDKISRVRVHPEFLKFAGLLFGVMEEAVAYIGLQAKKTPLLQLLQEKDPGDFNPNIILIAIPDQLFFSRDAFDAVVPLGSKERSAFSQALAYHKLRLLEELPKIDIYDFLEGSLSAVETIQHIRDTLQPLEKKVLADKKKVIGKLHEELKSFAPNSDRVITLLQDLAGKKDLTFEKQVRDVVDKARAQKGVAVQLLEVLKQASKDYKNKPASEFIYNKIKDIVDPKTFETIEQKFMSLYRTPLTIRSMFFAQIKVGKEIEKVAPKQSFYKWIEPYGFLLNLS